MRLVVERFEPRSMLAGLPTPIVDPVVYVNPTAWQGGLWPLLHADYFVIKGTIGDNRGLAPGETFTVTVNGATFAPAVDATTGGWSVYIKSVGTHTADMPVSGALDGWSTTDTNTYNVVARLTDGTTTNTDATTSELVIDMTAPSAKTVGIATPPGPNGYYFKPGDVIDLYVTYTEPMRVVGAPFSTPQLQLNTTPAAFANFDRVDGDEVHFKYVVKPGDSATTLNISGAAAILLGGGANIEDLAGNTATNTLPTTLPNNTLPPIVIDSVVPVVTQVGGTSTGPDGTYYAGTTIPITITFSEGVVVTGLPRLQLNVPGGYANFASTSADKKTLTFNYAVQPGDNTYPAKLDQFNSSALDLNGGTITDFAGNPAVLTLPLTSLSANNNLVIAAAPTVTGVSSPTLGKTYSAGDEIEIWVTFSKPVTVTGTPTLALAVPTGTPTALATYSATLTTPPNTLKFVYLVRPVDTTGGTALNYLAGGLSLSGGQIRYTWTGASAPGFLDADLTTLPPPTMTLKNTLPTNNIVIAPDAAAPVMPTVVLASDSANDIGDSPIDGMTNVATVNVSGLETKSGGTWQYSYDNGANWSAPVPTTTTTFTLPSNSTFAAGTVQVKQTDWSGNTSVIGSNPIAWTTDTAAPLPLTAATITETGVPGSGFTNDGTVTVTGLAANALLEWKRVSDTTWNTATVVNQFKFVLGKGVYNPAATPNTGIIVRQQDLAGNSSPSIQLSTAGGVTGITVVIDTTVAAPTIGFSPNDTTPGFAPYNAAPYNADGFTSNGQVNVTGLEVQNIAGSVSGIAKWEYRVNAGAWTLGGTTSPSGTFTLPAGTYVAGSVEVRETDLAGNQVTVSNPTTWTVDQTGPTVTLVTAPSGPHAANAVVPITVTFGETVFLTGTPTLSLGNNGRTATLASPTPTGPTTTLVFNYVVQPGDIAAALQVTAFNLNGATVADVAGNAANLGTGFFPATLPGPVVIKTDTVAATPLVAFASDTAPGVGSFTGVPYSTDGYTSNGVVNVNGLETLNLPNSQTGIASWEYSTDGGLTWTTTNFATAPTTLPTPNATFTLAAGGYAVNAIQVRQTDVAGNTSTAWTNAIAWTVDQTAPAIQSITAPAGTYGIGSTVMISVNFGELVYLSAAPTLTLDTGATATLSAATPITVGNSTLQFTYVVRAGDVTSGLKVTAFNVAAGTMADKAGNVAALPLVTTPVSVVHNSPPGPITVDASIKATAPTLVGSATASGPALGTALTTLQIVFNTPVRNFTLSSLKLYWNPVVNGTPTRLMALTGASIRMVGTSGTTYALTLPKAATNAKGAYMLVVGGPASTVSSVINPSALMTSPSRIYFRRV